MGIARVWGLLLGALVAGSVAFGQSAALEREYAIRGWALALGGDGGDVDAWSRAAVSPEWKWQRAAAVAVKRAPRLADEARAFDVVRGGLESEQPSVVEASLAAVERHGWFARVASDEAGRGVLRGLAAAKLPGVRIELARAAARLAEPSVLSVVDPRMSLRIEVLLALIDDEDPGVRGAARAALFLMESPSLAAPDRGVDEVLNATRTALLHRLVVAERFDEVVASLELLARAVPERESDVALRGWAAEDAPALAAGLGLDEVTVRGLVEAVISVRGGMANGALVARAFADWVLVRTSYELELNLDTWAVLERLFEAGAEGPGDAVVEGLFAEALGCYALEGEGLACAWSQAAGSLNASEVTEEEFSRRLFGAVAAGRPAERALALFVAHRWRDRQYVWFLEQFSSGLVASDLHGLDVGLGLNGELRTPFTWMEADGSVRPGALFTLVEELAMGQGSRPDAATELLLLDALDQLDVESPYWFAEAARFEAAWRAIVAAHFVQAGELGPTGLMDTDELFGRLSRSMTAFWKESAGVRLDLLAKLPRVAAMEAFVPLLEIVGDAGGVTAGYRGACVELLGACRGSEAVHEILVRWLTAEREAAADAEWLLRGDELEFAGLARAIAANGASMGLGEEEVASLLELAIARGAHGEVAKELGKAAVTALASYADGAERLDARFFGDVESGDAVRLRRLRIEAALQVLPRVEERAIAALAADLEFAGWDLAPRMLRALGESDLPAALEALLAMSKTHLGPEAPVEAVSLLDALVAVAGRRKDVHGEVVGALMRALTLGQALELRGAALDRLVPQLNEGVSEDAALLLALNELVLSAEASAAGELPFGFDKLSADELEYLRNKATVALAVMFENGARLGRLVLGPAIAAGGAELEARWRGGDPKGAEFAARTALLVFAARANQAELLAPGWERADGRFLLRLAKAADAELAARLLDACLVALEGEPRLDDATWTEAAARRLALAWQAGDWAAAGQLAGEMSWRRRRGRLPASGLRGTLGTRDAQRGIDSTARIESLRFQAAAHLAEVPGPYIERAAELVGISHTAAADQATL